MVKTSNLAEKEKWVMLRIVGFYKDPFNYEKLMSVIGQSENGRSHKKVSLRLVDWFVTNYSKKFNIVYPIKRPNGKTEYFSVYQNYRQQVSSYPKKLFDPFCRSNLIKIQLCGQFVETTVCQLHFFKWAIENLLLEYIEKNHDDIYKDMSEHCPRPRGNAVKKVKMQLSTSIHQKMLVLSCTSD